ncbi:MAG: phytoene synthase [Alteromonadaceae bacterium]|nr:phytoene synthase [Alteromonadaceae bacterium]
MTPHTDMSDCRRLLSHGSKSFYIASHFLPRTLRESASGLYAFCRIADDLVDLGDDPCRALVTLHRRLDLIYDGQPDNDPIDRVLSQIVIDHKLPRGLLDALLEGFEWDTKGREYHTLPELCDYGARVAGTVGVMMAILMGVKDHATLARAADLGVAMQLTNICRDVGEDARAGRLYLPRDMMRAAGIDPDAFLHNPTPSAELTHVLKRVLAEAQRRYELADEGIHQLPRSCRPGILAARRLYAEIGQTVVKNGYDSISRRAVVSRARKGQILFGLTRGPAAAPELMAEPCAAENQFLLNAFPHTEEWQRPNQPRHFSANPAWMIELFMVMKQRDEIAIQSQSNERK